MFTAANTWYWDKIRLIQSMVQQAVMM